MEIIKGNRVRFVKPKNVYQVTVETLEFIDDKEIGSNSFKLKFENTDDDLEELRESIIALECCSKQYPNGKSGFEGYGKLPYFEEYLMEDWHLNHYKHIDLFKSYKVRFYDENGNQHKINITNDEEMIDIITNCEVRI